MQPRDGSRGAEPQPDPPTPFTQAASSNGTIAGERGSARTRARISGGTRGGRRLDHPPSSPWDEVFRGCKPLPLRLQAEARPYQSPLEAPDSMVDQPPGNGQGNGSEGTPEPGNGHPEGGHPTDSGTPQRKRVCGAQLRGKPGVYCQRKPSVGSNRCKLHGGASHPGGPGHPTYRKGFYSKLLPQGLRKTYDKVLADPDTMNAAEEIALLKTRIGQLVSRLQTGETGSVWGDLQSAYSELMALARSPDPDPTQFTKALNDLGRVINRGADIELVWEELYEAIDKKTWVAAREWKRQVDLKQVITAERALALITAIMHSVVRNVDDLQARTRISLDVRSLIASQQEETPG